MFFIIVPIDDYLFKEIIPTTDLVIISNIYKMKGSSVIRAGREKRGILLKSTCTTRE